MTLMPMQNDFKMLLTQVIKISNSDDVQRL